MIIRRSEVIDIESKLSFVHGKSKRLGKLLLIALIAHRFMATCASLNLICCVIVKIMEFPKVYFISKIS